ncbi:myelin-associated glycoprotein isoform X1 [Microcaecilia unicolor]|uniref:Myelin-associated glycoprotein-like isoform X1 n=1 Tax=Microcaecilia unicolor TaxID=1415580 RepID=A0A6P7YQ39_9AMPH|nr:myelin-associated glycoprotein-like isoform X1 [Microcaecilia unicolor]XP_030067112.1 myelin-associated glycoprotein-like isoform X1 [Microcaecilia unicolor]XP_030067113.1 myelin-associated glycoprotein-like isoform X1 [Microcaecilia unicolor]XP_030067115.1 myelin-associated glycoprotein-like isoform X1 [Microcaecilia unicolor]
MSIICTVFFLQVCLQALLPVNADWTARTPRSLMALKDSCLVIPCTFNYPGQSKPQSDITAIWYQNEYTILYQSDKPETQGRAALVGNLEHKNCSLWIKQVKKEDGVSYKLRLEIRNLDKYSFPSSPHVTVQERPTDPQLLGYRSDLTEGELLTITCRTTHTCIVNPPTLLWQPQFDMVQEEHRMLGEGEWEVVSKQTFLVSANHHQKAVSCKAQYPSGQEARITGKTFSVLYSPQNTSVRIRKGIKTPEEGSSVSLMCSSNSNPPATSYTWYRVLKDTILRLPENNHTLQATNISRANPSYFCMVKNELGAQNSTLLHFNVQYKPEILPESNCVFHYRQFECQCLVRSNPSAVITWYLSDRKVKQTDVDISLNFNLSSSMTRSLLVGPTSLGANISCTASNKLGVTQLGFHGYGSWYQSWIVPTAAAVGALFILLFTAAVIGCIWKRRKKDQIKKDPDIAVLKTARQEKIKNGIHSKESFLTANSTELYVNVDFIKFSKHRKSAPSSGKKSSEGSYQSVFSDRYDDAIYQNY